MLLTRLAEHAAHRSDLPPLYYRYRAVRWVISIRSDGTPAAPNLQDRAGSDHPAGAPMPAPYVYRSGMRPPPVLLVDTLQYVLRFQPDSATDKDHAEAGRRNGDYTALLARWRESAPSDGVARAVLDFFESGRHLSLTVPKDAKPTDLVAVMVAGEWAHLQDSAISYWARVVRERKTSAGSAGICLVCGQGGALLDTIPEAVKAGAIPAGRAQSRDAQLVSVNKPAQGRGGKIQLSSTPVCERCGSAAMSALNALLADETHRHRAADSVLVWWLRDPASLNPLDWLNQPEPNQVRKLIEELGKPRPGPSGGVDTNAFYAATLSVNQSRVVMRDWLEAPLREVQKNIGVWFADHQMTDLWRDGPQVVPLWLLARSAGRWGNENGQSRYLAATVPNGCERDLLLAALRGTRPPAYLLPRLLQRIRADGRIDLPRAALLRLTLTRNTHVPEETCMPGLAPDAPSPAYQSGRMFALLEQIQRAALGEVNATIADKFLPAATTAPRVILVMLKKNASGHLRRLRRSSPGAYHALNGGLDEVLGHFGADKDGNIPAVLDIEGQAQFVLGYHHQRAADMAAARARRQQNPPPVS